MLCLSQYRRHNQQQEWIKLLLSTGLKEIVGLIHNSVKMFCSSSRKPEMYVAFCLFVWDSAFALFSRHVCEHYIKWWCWKKISSVVQMNPEWKFKNITNLILVGNSEIHARGNRACKKCPFIWFTQTFLIWWGYIKPILSAWPDATTGCVFIKSILNTALQLIKAAFIARTTFKSRASSSIGFTLL